MKMKSLKYIGFGIILIAFTACLKTEFDAFEPVSSGELNFTRFISLGNSLTQGFQDDGLHNERGQQKNSYPAIIARQMGADFEQPLVGGAGSGYKFLQDLEPTVIDIPADPNFDINAAKLGDGWIGWNTSKQYNNLGISAMKLADIFPTPGDPTAPGFNYLIMNGNTFGKFMNFGTAADPITYMDHIIKSKATFFTCWLGNNDVLGWAQFGGDDSNLGINKLTALTPVAEFRMKYDSLFATLTSMGAKGICATIPDVTTVPLFTTITIDAAEQDIWITEGPYAANRGLVRKAVPEDLILLSSKEAMEKPAGHGFVESDPLTHKEVLDRDEVKLAQERTIALNAEIKASAATYGIPVLDMYEKLFGLESGLSFDGVEFKPEYIEGGFFSLDGIHLNSRGYAVVANLFMELINETYGSTLKPVSVNDYPGILFP